MKTQGGSRSVPGVKMDVLNENFLSPSTYSKLLTRIKGKSINNCDFFWLLIVFNRLCLPKPIYATARMSPVLSNIVNWVFENTVGSCATFSVFNNIY